MQEAAPSYPGAVAAQRSYDFDSDGFRLRLHEWGDPAGKPLVLAHGMFDHAHGFDLLAPILAERFRVVAVDARGHGDSAWADSYTWSYDTGDLIRVLHAFGRCHLLGHSKGGGQATAAARHAPDAVDKLVNIEGFGPPEVIEPAPGQPPRPQPGTPAGLGEFFDMRGRLHERPDWRPYPTLDDLVARRKSQNPRLSEPWLRYFCAHGSRRAPDGLRWKVDPLAGMGTGPWKPQWIGPSWRGLRPPMLAIVGVEQDTWGPPEPAMLASRLSYVSNVEQVAIEQAGHFPHMEQPEATARVVLDFLTA